MFLEFCDIMQIDINELKQKSDTELDDLLTKFYFACKKKDGSEYTSSSLSTIRYSLNRSMTKIIGRNVDIVKNSIFNKSSDMFESVKTKLKRTGKANVTHTPTISYDDLQTINNMPDNTPHCLQLKAWFLIQFHFIRRGVENSREMTRDYFEISEDNTGQKFAKPRKDELTKNHRQSDTDESIAGRMYATYDENCPVKVLEKYISKLSPTNDALWQRPRDSFTDQDDVWYTQQPVGVNTIAKFMRKICTFLDLKTTYTNHCPRATAITALGVDFEENDIKSISGHKSNNALGKTKM